MATKDLKESLVSFLEGNTLTRNMILKPIREYRLDNHYRRLAKLEDLNAEELENWSRRIEKVKLSNDNQKINKVQGSGALKNGKLTMHNSLQIDPLSYYGAPMLKMFMENEGVHEPQEEFVFQEVLKTIKPGALMLELGCYWGFYSMWFAQKIENSKNYLIDNSDGIARAKTNFKLNNLHATFLVGYIGKDNPHSEIPLTNVDRIAKENNIEFIDILHADIQGFELEMLETLPNLLAKRAIGYIFISTHSNELHYNCINWLETNGYKILCHSDLDHTFSEDGLIVARDLAYPGLDEIEISQFDSAQVKA